MRFRIICLLTVFTFLLIARSPKEAQAASLLTVDKEGALTWSVLSSEDDFSLSIPAPSSMEVKSVASNSGSNLSTISLTKLEDKISMEVSSGSETRNLELSNWEEDLVELEERPEVKNIKIGIVEDKFSIRQKRITALTDFPLTIDSESAKLTLATSTGDKYLSILPLDAVETLMKSKLMTNVKDNRIEIVEEESDLQYKIAGEKVFNLFDLYNYPVEVTSHVSASTGEILSVDGPTWFKVINFLMT